MHSRRKFEAALDGGDVRAAIAMNLYRQIYAVERACKDEGLDADARRLRRIEQTEPAAARAQGLGRGTAPEAHSVVVALGKGTTYLTGNWEVPNHAFWRTAVSRSTTGLSSASFAAWRSAPEELVVRRIRRGSRARRRRLLRPRDVPNAGRRALCLHRRRPSEAQRRLADESNRRTAPRRLGPGEEERRERRRSAERRGPKVFAVSRCVPRADLCVSYAPGAMRATTDAYHLEAEEIAYAPREPRPRARAVTDSPELDDFRRRIEELASHKLLGRLVKRGEVHFQQLSVDDVAALMRERDKVAYYFLIAAAELNRTTLKKAAEDEEAKLVALPQRRAFAVKNRLPLRRAFADVASSAIALRAGDLGRKSRGAIESLFRDRLKAEGILQLMSPPVRQVPGILIGKRKPDGDLP